MYLAGKDLQAELESIVKSQHLRKLNSNVQGCLVRWGSQVEETVILPVPCTSLKRKMRKLIELQGEEDTRESGNLWGPQGLEPET